MEMFDDGGLKDQGGSKDEESGNDVPSGSLKKEVRDDIPAMVSEGEFIFPADVVRYHGLDKLMSLRQEAKAGLQVMEKMGQMGNSEEATIPDDLPFDIDDIIIMDDDGKKEMAEGGLLFAQEGTDVNRGSSGFTDMLERPKGLAPRQSSYDTVMGGSNKYDSKRVAYKDKDGKIVYILEDYMKRPQQSTEGLTRVESLKPDDGSDSDGPIDDTVIPEEEAAPRDTENRDRRRAEKAEATKIRNQKALETSAGRLGIPVDVYSKLPLASRLALMGEEMKSMSGGEVDASAVKSVLDNPPQSGIGGFGILGKLLGGLGAGIEKFLGKVGFDVDGDGNFLTTTKVKDANGNWVDKKVKVEEDGSVADEELNKTEESNADSSTENKGSTEYQDPYETGSFSGTQSGITKDNFNDMNTVMDEQGNLITKPATTEVASVDTPSGLGDLAAGDTQGRGPQFNLNATTPAFTQAPLKNLGTDVTGDVEPKSTAIEGEGGTGFADRFRNKEGSRDRYMRDKAREKRSSEREDKANKERKKNYAKADKKDKERFEKRKRESKESTKSKVEKKKEAANVRDYGISGLNRGGIMKKKYP